MKVNTTTDQTPEEMEAQQQISQEEMAAFSSDDDMPGDQTPTAGQGDTAAPAVQDEGTISTETQGNAESGKGEQEPTQKAPEPTQDQINLQKLAQDMQRLMSGMDKAHGNYGELKRELQAIKQAAATPQAAANYEIPDGDVFKDLDDFGMPELKDGISKGVQAAIEQRLSKFNLPQGMTTEQLGQYHAELRNVEIEQEIEAGNALLDKHYPDRFELVKTPEWKVWEAQQNPIAMEVFYNTRDPEKVALRLDAFKSWRAEQASKKTTQANRLEAAIAPRGDRAPSPPEQSMRDAELAAFMSND